MTHPSHQEKHMSRQAFRTIEAIKTSSSVSYKSITGLLDCLGFTRKQTGSHLNFRHTKGYRVSLVNRTKDNSIHGYELKNLRNLISEIEANEGTFASPVTERKEENTMAMSYEKVKEKHGFHEVAAFYDQKTLTEKALPDLTKLDLTKLNEKNALRAVSDAHNEMTSYLKRLGSMTQSIQDYLIELSVKIDEINAVALKPVGIHLLPAGTQEPEPPKPKRSPEELAALRSEIAKQMHKERSRKVLQKVKDAQKTHPQFAKNLPVLAGLSGVGLKTIEKYLKDGLLLQQPQIRELQDRGTYENRRKWFDSYL